MNKQSTQQMKSEDLEVLGAMDKFFLFMASGYLVAWFLSIPFFRSNWDDASHGGFFDHVGLIALVYTALSVTNFASKQMPRSAESLNVVSYGLLGFFLAFPFGGIVGACIVAVIVAFFAFKKAWDTSFVTGALGGYWFMLFIVSCFEYNPFTKVDEGIMAMVFEFFGALFNMADFNVHKMTLSWFILVPIGIGYFFFRTFNSVETAEKPKEETPKETLETVTKPIVEVATPQASPVIAIKQDDIPSSTTSESKTPKRRYKKEETPKEKPSKGFFNLQTPMTKVKLKNWWEQKLRNLSK